MPKHKDAVELIEDGKQSERFEAMTKKLVSVPKKELDRRLEEEKRRKIREKSQR